MPLYNVIIFVIIICSFIITYEKNKTIKRLNNQLNKKETEIAVLNERVKKSEDQIIFLQLDRYELELLRKMKRRLDQQIKK